jgi:tetratricopeptide (TPR) repeat protein
MGFLSNISNKIKDVLNIPQPTIDDAKQLEQTDHHNEALSTLKKVSKNNPKNADLQRDIYIDMGDIHKHMGNWDKSVESFKKAKGYNSLSRNKDEHKEERLDHKIQKYSLRSEGPIKPIPQKELNKPHTTAEWLANSAFSQDKDINNKALESLNNLSNDPNLKEFYDVNAVTSINNPKSNITYVKGENTDSYDKGSNAKGYFNDKNSVVVASENSSNYAKDSFRDVAGTQTHELVHRAMKETYHNEGKPYAKSDLSAEQQFDQSAKETFKNIGTKLDPKENYIKFNDNMTSQEMGVHLRDNYLKAFGANWQENSLTTDDLRVAQNVTSAYSDSYNKQQANHAELVVRTPQLRAEGVSEKSLEVLKPLENDINNRIKPDIKKTIDQNPNKHLLKDQVKENESSKKPKEAMDISQKLDSNFAVNIKKMQEKFEKNGGVHEKEEIGNLAPKSTAKAKDDINKQANCSR